MKIVIEKKYIDNLSSVFDCSKILIYKSLNFERYSMKARKIRFDAMNKYHGTFIEVCPKNSKII